MAAVLLEHEDDANDRIIIFFVFSVFVFFFFLSVS